MEISVSIGKKNLKTYYLAKANDSFKTKLNLFVFEMVLNHRDGSFSTDEFVNFKITRNLVDLYTTEYWQLELGHVIQPYGLTCESIYRKISGMIKLNSVKIEEFRNDYVINRFPEIFKPDDFNNLLAQNHCEYCNITLEEIENLADKRQLRKKSLRGWTLEIDRIDSNFEYTPNNCVMACYWCNNAKTDEFTAEEFKEMGKVIRTIWDKRLNS